MIFFTTIISNSHIYKFLVLYKTLLHNCNSFRLFVLCVDNKAETILKRQNLKNVTVILYSQIIDDDLEAIKCLRTKTEFCWTLKPSLLNYVMNNYKDADYYAHIDSDLCFFCDPMQIFNENPNANIFLTSHNNSNRFYKYYDITGVYNTGFVGFSNSIVSKVAVLNWRMECNNWCYVQHDQQKGLYGDQRYVEKWPRIYSGVHIVNSKGANVAIWNIDNYSIKVLNNHVFIDNDILTFYHFSGLNSYNAHEHNLSHFYRLCDEAVRLIYYPYLSLLCSTIEDLQKNKIYISEAFVKKGCICDVHYFLL